MNCNQLCLAGRFTLIVALLSACGTARRTPNGKSPNTLQPYDTVEKRTPKPLNYPATRRGDVIDDYHGVAVADPYRWLESIDSTETRDWVGLQNELALDLLKNLESRAYFLRRAKALCGAATTSRVSRVGAWWLTRERTLEGAHVFYVQRKFKDPLRYLFGPNEVPLSQGVVREVSLSPDGRYLAYVMAAHGPSALELHIRNLETGVDLAERIPGIRWGRPHWTANSAAIIYSRLARPGIDEPDGIDRKSLIGYHVLGTEPSFDSVLYAVDQQDVGAGAVAVLSSDGRYVVIDDHYDHEDSISVIDLGDPLNPNPNREALELTHGRQATSRFVGSLGGSLFFRTTVDAPLGRIIAVRLEQPRSWRTVISESEDLLERARLVGGRLMVGHRRDVCSRVGLFDLEGNLIHDVGLPGIGSAYYFSGDESNATACFAYDSLAHPESTFALDTASGQTARIRAPTLDVDPQDFLTQQQFYRSADGTRIPLFICRRRDLPSSAANPTLLIGYGANAAVMDPIFNPDWFAWVEAGGILAIANVRGGGEYGEAWHRAGMLENKQNSFDDFIAAAEHLTQTGVTTSEMLAIHGSSNGGMLVGAALTQRPDLFAAALPNVGVLDALRFPSFTAGPRWAKDMGDPSIAEQFEWIQRWSPLHRIEAGKNYPAILITTAIDDDIVHPSQSFKFAARLQEAQKSVRPTLLRIYPGGGHAGRRDLGGRAHEMADRLAFAAHFTGLAARSNQSKQ